MARKYSDCRVDPFLRVQQLIYGTFDKIISTATDRRGQLLAQLEEFKLAFLRKEAAREMGVRESEISLEILREIQAARDQQGLDSRSSQCPIPTLITEDFQSLLQKIEAFGHIEGTAGPYVNKKKHFGTFGKKGGGKGDLNDPKGLALDGENRLYVADFLNQRVQVFSQDRSVVTEFGQKVLFRPYGIALHDEQVFVSDRQLGIVFKFLLPSYKVVSKSGKGKLESPSGLTVDTDGEVFVADRGNDRVVVLGNDLEQLRQFGQEILDYPQDVKVTASKVLVADNSKHRNIHVFSKSGRHLRSIIKLERGTRDIFLCLDLYETILISDFASNSIQIFSLEGRLVHRIESNPNPTGIAVMDNFHIVSARHYLFTSDVRLY